MARPHDVIAEAIASTGRDVAQSVDSDGAMCTGWIVIAEWTDADGAYWVTRLSDDTSPTWRIKGLLHDALYNWQYASEDGE